MDFLIELFVIGASNIADSPGKSLRTGIAAVILFILFLIIMSMGCNVWIGLCFFVGGLIGFRMLDTRYCRKLQRANAPLMMDNELRTTALEVHEKQKNEEQEK
jgi:hypothetical protein